MLKGLKRVAVAGVVMAGFAIGTTVPAGATGQTARAWMHNQCKKEWLGEASGGVWAFANGNGYAQLSWGGGTQVTDRRYWDDPSTNGYEDRSCIYNDFVQLDYRLTRGGNCAYNACGWGRMADESVGYYDYIDYPPEGVGFEWESTHYWGGGEASRCGGYYWFVKLHGEAHVPHYTPHPPHQFMEDSGMGDPVAANAPLIADLESTNVPLDASAIQPRSTGEIVDGVIANVDPSTIMIRIGHSGSGPI